MSGHNKWSKIKNKKGAEDAKKSNLFSKLSKQIIAESKKCGGDLTSPSLIATIEIAKKENMPKDTIERAIKKGADKDTLALDNVTYEAYLPGGAAIIIEGLTDSKNRTAAEVRHLLSKRGIELAPQGAASWAFTKTAGKWIPNTMIPVSESDGEKIGEIIDELEALEDVQETFNNAE